jgi:hypothetical protein
MATVRGTGDHPWTRLVRFALSWVVLTPAILLLATTLHLGPERPIQTPLRDSQPGRQDLSHIAARGDMALVLWDETSALRGARVERDGKTIDTTPLLLGQDFFLEHSAVAAGPNGWMVVWSHGDGVIARTVAANGALGEPLTIAVTEDRPIVHVAFDGQTYLIALEGSTAFAGARLSETGQLLENFFITAADGRSIAGLHADPEGGFVLVAWRREIDVLRLDGKGRVRSSGSVAKATSLQRVVSGLDEQGQLVMSWVDGFDLYRKSGTSAPALVLQGSADAPPNLQSIVTAGGTTFVLFVRGRDVVMKNLDIGSERVWVDARRPVVIATASFGDRVLMAAEREVPVRATNTSRDLFMSVVDTAMADVEPTRRLYVELRNQYQPVIASGLVAWLESAEDARLQLRAKIGYGDPIIVADEARDPVRVASSGNGFLLLWFDLDLRPWVRHIRNDGTMSEPVRIADVRTTGGNACLTWTGSEYVAAYVRYIGATSWRIIGRVFVQPLTGEGAPIEPALPLTSDDFYTNVTCASSETSTLFVWGGINGIYGTLRTAGGSMASPFYISSSDDASVASNGTGFLVGTEWGEVVPVSGEGTLGAPIFRPEFYRQVILTAYAGNYVLFSEILGGPLEATPLDERGEVVGESVVIAFRTSHPHVAGSTLVYRRETSPDLPRGQVFIRELSTSTKRRALR